MSLGERLGDADTRRRRHIRFAILATVLVAIAAILVFLVDGDDDDQSSGDFAADATAECEAFSERLANEFELSFPEGPPNEEAIAEYLARAFADTMDDLVASLRALGPDAEAAAAIDDLEARIDEVRADPAAFASGERFVGDGIAEAFDELGLPACGSDFALS